MTSLKSAFFVMRERAPFILLLFKISFVLSETLSETTKSSLRNSFQNYVFDFIFSVTPLHHFYGTTMDHCRYQFITLIKLQLRNCMVPTIQSLKLLTLRSFACNSDNFFYYNIDVILLNAEQHTHVQHLNKTSIYNARARL